MKLLRTSVAVLALAAACVPRAAKIPPKAVEDMKCPQSSLTVMEVDNQGDNGPHLVMGCGKRAVYELNNLGDWVVNAPIATDPSHVKPPPPPDTQAQ